MVELFAAAVFVEPDAVVVWVFELVPDDRFAVFPEAAGAVHHRDEDALVVLPEGRDGVTDPAGVEGVGVELADVLDALSVLEVPPLTVGWTLMAG